MTGYTSIDNDIFEAGLSARALGVLVLMLSKPPGWEFSSERIALEVREGRDAVRAALRELVAAGFMERKTLKWNNHPQVRHSLRDSLRSPWMEPKEAWESVVGKPGGKVRPLGLTDLTGLTKASTETATQPACGGVSHPEEEDQDVVSSYGGDSDKKPTEGGKPSGQVIRHMTALWPAVVTANPTYRNNLGADQVAFARYLNDNFFGPKAKTPLSLDQVKDIVTRFMRDLQYGSFSLKQGQPVWMSFTRRWQNYPIEAPMSQHDRRLADQRTIVYIKQGDTSANS